MGGEEHVVEVLCRVVRTVAIEDRRQHGKHVTAREHQLGADRDREQHADKAGANREDQIERADVLVVGREQEAPPPGRMAMLLVLVVRMRFRMSEIAD